MKTEKSIVRKENTRFEFDQFVMQITPEIGRDEIIKGGDVAENGVNFFKNIIAPCVAKGVTRTIYRRTLAGLPAIFKADFPRYLKKEEKHDTKNFVRFTQAGADLVASNERTKNTVRFKKCEILQDGDAFMLSFWMLKEMMKGVRGEGVEIQAHINERKKLDVVKLPRDGFLRIGNRYAHIAEPKKPGSL